MSCRKCKVTCAVAVPETCLALWRLPSLMLYMRPSMTVVITLLDSGEEMLISCTQGRSVNFWMTAYVAFASADSGALPGRSTTTE
jgi:hypothetical protein